MVHAEIPILPLLGRSLDTRDEAIKLFENLKQYCTQCGELLLDFSKIDFMSRSFADQFHKEKMKWVTISNVSILISNASVQVIEILQAVAKTQSTKKVASDSFSIYSFSREEQLSEYLNAI